MIYSAELLMLTRSRRLLMQRAALYLAGIRQRREWLNEYMHRDDQNVPRLIKIKGIGKVGAVKQTRRKRNCAATPNDDSNVTALRLIDMVGEKDPRMAQELAEFLSANAPATSISQGEDEEEQVATLRVSLDKHDTVVLNAGKWLDENLERSTLALPERLQSIQQVPLTTAGLRTEKQRESASRTAKQQRESVSRQTPKRERSRQQSQANGNRVR